MAALYLNPHSRYNNGPNPLNIAQKAIILHTFGGPGRSWVPGGFM